MEGCHGGNASRSTAQLRPRWKRRPGRNRCTDVKPSSGDGGKWFPSNIILLFSSFIFRIRYFIFCIGTYSEWRCCYLRKSRDIDTRVTSGRLPLARKMSCIPSGPRCVALRVVWYHLARSCPCIQSTSSILWVLEGLIFLHLDRQVGFG